MVGDPGPQTWFVQRRLQGSTRLQRRRPLLARLLLARRFVLGRTEVTQTGQGHDKRSFSGKEAKYGNDTDVAQMKTPRQGFLPFSFGGRLNQLLCSEPDTDDRALPFSSTTAHACLPLSSTTAHACQATVATAATESDADLAAAVKSAYANINAHKIERITPKPFHAALDKTDAAKQLTRSVKLAAPHILVRCDDRCLDGLDSECRVSGWELPPRKCVQRTIVL